MRRILFSTLKILISAALLYFSLRKVNLSELASRIDIASLGWIGDALAVAMHGEAKGVPLLFLRLLKKMLRQLRQGLGREMRGDCVILHGSAELVSYLLIDRANDLFTCKHSRSYLGSSKFKSPICLPRRSF